MEKHAAPSVLGIFMYKVCYVCEKHKFWFLQQIFIIVDTGMAPSWYLRMVVEEMASSSSTFELEGRVSLVFFASLPNIIKTALFTGD